MQELKREYRSTIFSTLMTMAVAFIFQILITVNFVKTMNSSNENSPITLVSIIVVWLIAMTSQFFAVRNCYRKFKDKNNTTLVRSIRKQLPAYESSRDLDYIFSILDSDFDNPSIEIKNFRLGNEWMIGSSDRGSVAIKYANIQNFKWTRSNTRKKNIKGLSIVCLNETYRFQTRGNYDVFLYLREMFPEKEYTTMDAQETLTKIYEAFRENIDKEK